MLAVALSHMCSYPESRLKDQPLSGTCYSHGRGEMAGAGPQKGAKSFFVEVAHIISTHFPLAQSDVSGGWVNRITSQGGTVIIATKIHSTSTEGRLA